MNTTWALLLKNMLNMALYSISVIVQYIYSGGYIFTLWPAAANQIILYVLCLFKN